MKRAIICGILAAALAACDNGPGAPTGPSLSGPLVFSAPLSAGNEVPPVTNSEAGARGTVTITMDVPRDTAGNVTGGGTVTFALSVTGFAPGSAAIAAHIHPGPAGVNGPILVPVAGLAPTAPIVMADGTAAVSFTGSPISQTAATQIAAAPEAFYFNLHTPVNPGGAVRGQLARIR